MTSSLTKRLALGAVMFAGLLAGVTASRDLVEMPAWERIGIIPWANFTRAENVALGFLFYPVVGLAALLFTAATAIAVRFDRGAAGSRRAPVYIALILAITWAAITRGILVPAMFSLRTAGDNVLVLQRIFASVFRWQAVNDVLHVLTFGFNLWALAEVFSKPKTA